MENNSTKSSGIGFSSLLTIVFVTLKLIGKISWPWVWVLSPLWIPLAIYIVILIIYAIIHTIAKS